MTNTTGGVPHLSDADLANLNFAQEKSESAPDSLASEAVSQNLQDWIYQSAAHEMKIRELQISKLKIERPRNPLWDIFLLIFTKTRSTEQCGVSDVQEFLGASRATSVRYLRYLEGRGHLFDQRAHGCTEFSDIRLSAEANMQLCDIFAEDFQNRASL